MTCYALQAWCNNKKKKLTESSLGRTGNEKMRSCRPIMICRDEVEQYRSDKWEQELLVNFLSQESGLEA